MIIRMMLLYCTPLTIHSPRHHLTIRTAHSSPHTRLAIWCSWRTITQNHIKRAFIRHILQLAISIIIYFFLSRRFVAEERRGNKIVFYALSQTNICRWNNIDAAILTNKSIWTTAIVLCDAVDAWTTVLAWIRVAFIPIRLALHTGVSIDAITRICTVDENGNRERKIEWDILYIMMRMGECSFRGKKKNDYWRVSKHRHRHVCM